MATSQRPPHEDQARDAAAKRRSDTLLMLGMLTVLAVVAVALSLMTPPVL